jgi:hypothetical protein
MDQAHACPPPSPTADSVAGAAGIARERASQAGHAVQDAAGAARDRASEASGQVRRPSPRRWQAGGAAAFAAAQQGRGGVLRCAAVHACLLRPACLSVVVQLMSVW